MPRLAGLPGNKEGRPTISTIGLSAEELADLQTSAPEIWAMLQARLQAKAAIVAQQEQAAAEAQHGRQAAHIRAMFAELDVTTSSIFHSVSSLPAGRLVELAPAYISDVQSLIAGYGIELHIKKAARLSSGTPASGVSGSVLIANGTKLSDMTISQWEAVEADLSLSADVRADAERRRIAKQAQNVVTNAAKVARDRAQRAAANAAEIAPSPAPETVAPAQSAEQVAAEAAALVSTEVIAPPAPEVMALSPVPAVIAPVRPARAKK